MKLYHFTSDYAAALIQETGELRPALHGVLGRSFVWLTSTRSPKPSELGLSRGRKKVNRMVHRFEVETDIAVPWSSVRSEFSDWGVSFLESAPGAKPEIWYVSGNALPISSQQPSRIEGALPHMQR